MGDQHTQIETLSPDEKRALLAKLLKQKAEQPRTFPLSFAQQRLWVIWQLNPQSPVYNVPAAIRTHDADDVALLERCLNEIVRRHEVLRTTVQVVDGEPAQVVAPECDLELPVTDLQHLPAAEREATIERLATEEARRPFDLEEGPLIRAAVLWLGDDGLVLLLTMHHIVADAWSIGILIQELNALYDAFRAGEPPPLPELPIQYADYAVWQRERMQGDLVDDRLAYWTEQLAGAPTLLELPTVKPRPPVQTFHGATHTFTLPAALSERVRAFGRRERTTPFMTLLSGFKALLSRYTRQTDLLVGTPVANRSRPEVQNLIGFFANTLVLRTKFDDDPSFVELARRIRQTTLDAYEHQDLPFERLVDELEPERDTSHPPLFQVLFTYRESMLNDFPDLETVALDTGTAKFDLSVAMVDHGDTLAGECEYNTDLFDRATIKQMMHHFQILLSEALAAPDTPVSRLPLLDADERRRLLVEFNDTDVAFPDDRCIHHLFEEQVERTPDTIALIAGDERIRYRDLDARANRLARYLRRHEVGPETLVGICLNRSPDMVVAVLAVLKAGGAYLPLDPDYPRERLAFMVRDAGVRTVISTTALAERLPTQDADLICLDHERIRIAGESAEPLVTTVGSDSLAYVLYTSGSTGRPKGVMITHVGVCNLAQAQREGFVVTPESRVFQFASFSFDASVSELFVTLLTGAALVLPMSDALLPGPELVELLRGQRVTTMTCPPSVWAALPPEELPALTTVVSAGESCPAALVAQWREGRRFINAYGPTEATVCATLTACTDANMTPAIGMPIDNVRVYLLDDHLQPVPEGVVGELYVDGPGLARGYLGRPALTAEHFVPNPFSDEPGRRLYRTGDLGRYRSDGQIEFLGRADRQMMIRGFRIETGEVEATLRQHAAVRDVVVTAHERATGSKQLVAYVVAVSDEQLAPASLRAFLAERLPDYMVPTLFVHLDVLPLTPNGKVDHDALPAPDRTLVESDSAYVAPRNDVETALAGIWADVLNLRRVGIHDNFFELGGDSILAIQIVSRANREGLHLAPRQLFQHATIAELAAVAGTDTDGAAQAEQGLVDGPAPLTPIQHWFFAQDHPDPHHFNQAVLLRVRRPLDVTVLERAFDALVRQHDGLRLRFTPASAGWQQTHAPPADVCCPLEEIDLTDAPASTMDERIADVAETLHTGLNIITGPMMRAAYVRYPQGRRNRLLIVIHHLVVDRVSWRILLEDLHTAYRQFSQGETVDLPPKTTSFRRWAGMLHEYAQSETLVEEARDYWLAEAGEDIPALPVDVEATPDANTTHSARSVTTALGADVTQALLTEVHGAYNTRTDEVLLAALADAVATWAGAEAVRVDLEGHGREYLFDDVDLSRTVGWFTSLYPVSLTVGAAAGSGDLLTSIKEQLRAVPNHGVGYGLLRYVRDEAEIQRRLRAMPAAEISFNYLGQFEQPAAGDDGLFVFPTEAVGPLHGPDSRRAHLLELNSYVTEGQLAVEWSYSTAFHHGETIERLAARFMRALRAVISHCQSPDAGGYTPSDFPLAGLDEEKMERLADVLQETR